LQYNYKTLGQGKNMFGRPATLFDVIVVQNFTFLYRFRLFMFALAAAIYGMTPGDSLPGRVLAALFLGWLLVTAFFYLYGRASVTNRTEDVFFLQVLVDQVFLLFLLHASGGLHSPYLPVYALWLPLSIGLFPSKALPYLAAFNLFSLFFLLEAYRVGILVPYRVNVSDAGFALHYEIIILSSMGAAFWLINNWMRSFERNWQRTHQLSRVLQLMTTLAGRQDTQPLRHFDVLLREICALVGAPGAILAISRDGVVNILGKAGPVSMVSPAQIGNALGQLQRSNRPEAMLHVREFLVLPLGDEENFSGGLFLLKPEMESEIFLQSAREVARVLAVAIDQYVQYQMLREKVVLLDRLRDEIVHLTISIQPQDVLQGIAQAVRDLLKAQRLAIYTFQPDGALICSFASDDIAPNYIDWICRNYRSLPEWHQVLEQGYVAIADTRQDRRTSPQNYHLHQQNIRSYVLLNLTVDGRSQGLLALYWDAPRSFSHQEIEIARLFAARAAEMLENADRYDWALQAALTDELTGLPNRRALDRRLEEEVRRSQRYQRVFAYLMIDLDGFKKVNDQYGHPIGDSVLQQVAALLRQNTRDTDFLARYGGDEFAMVLPETDRENAMAVAQKVRDVLESCWLLLPDDERRQMLSACIGIAIYPEDASTTEGLLQCADQRLYLAKEKGRGSLIAHDPPFAIEPA
jgi:diguanylate cyclase (GGDEF)-like protein